MDSELAGRWLGLLRAAVSKIEIVGLLWDPGTGSAQLAAVKATAQGMDVKLLVLETRNAADLDGALGAGLNGGANALVVLSSPVVGATVNSKHIAVFTTSNRLPAISPFRSFAEAGGLMPKIRAGNITMNCDQQGSGEPLVLIPYLAADYACYAFQVADYAKHFTCISVDLRGTGESDKPAGVYSTETFADDVAALMG